MKGRAGDDENGDTVSEHPIGSYEWLREKFADKDWHRHRRTDGRTDVCDGTPSDCASKVRFQ